MFNPSSVGQEVSTQHRSIRIKYINLRLALRANSSRRICSPTIEPKIKENDIRG